MLQKFKLSIDSDQDLLVIKEYCVVGRRPANGDFTRLGEKDFMLTHHETYDVETIRSTASEGRQELISELRTDNFYPTAPCAERIADEIIDLVDADAMERAEFFFDDRALIEAE
jgi:hypothetical protein